MKKLIALLCVLLLTCFAVTAFADHLYKPNMPETLRALIAGKSFSAGINGLESTGEDEDAKFTLSITVYERDQFDASVIENLAAHDIICFGDGTAAVIKEVVTDEFGVIAKGFNDDAYSFFKTEGGTYIAATDTDNPFWTEVFTIKVPLEKDITFLDWSDPENLDEPVKLGFVELLDHLLEGTAFFPDNTQLTFDENGKLVEFLYNYSPWN